MLAYRGTVARRRTRTGATAPVELALLCGDDSGTAIDAMITDLTGARGAYLAGGLEATRYALALLSGDATQP